MKQNIHAANAGALPTSGTSYNEFFGGQAWNTTESVVQAIMPEAGNLRNLAVMVGTAPGAGTSWAFTLRVNGVDTALTCTVSNTSTTASDQSHTVAVNAGDLLTLSCAATGAVATSANNKWVIESEPTASNRCVLLGVSTANMNGANASWIGAHSGSAWQTVTTPNVVTYMSIGGTIQNFYVKAPTAPGSSKTWTISIRKNGAEIVATRIALTGTSPATGNLTNQAIAFSAGDYFEVLETPTSIPAAGPLMFGISLSPTTDGESPLCGSFSSSVTSGTKFSFPTNSIAGADTVEANVQGMAGVTSSTLKNFRASGSAAPSGSATRTWTYRKNTANANQTFVITGAATSGTDSVNTDTVVLNDLINIQQVGSTFASSAKLFWCVTEYIAPAAVVAIPNKIYKYLQAVNRASTY